MGFFSDVVSSVVSPVVDTAKSVVSTVAPYAGLIGAATGNPWLGVAGGMLGGALGGGGQAVSGGLTAAGNLLQGGANQAANQQAAQLASFRPVGITNSFGTSNFAFDPTTGQMTSAGYSLSPQLQSIQNDVLGGLRTGLNTAGTIQGLGQGYLTGNLGAPVTGLGSQMMGSDIGSPITQAGLGYLGINPQQAAQSWYNQQQALLAPSREQDWARLNQGNYARGTTGLKVAQGGGLQAANPYASALANAQAQQNTALAAQAQQQGLAQQQAGAGLYAQGQGLTQGARLAGAGLYGTGLGLTQAGQQFGQGLLSSAYNPLTAGLSTAGAIEGLGQQPLELSSSLAGRTATAGTNAANYLKQASSYNPTASILGGLGSNAALGNAISGLFNNNSIYDTSSWMPQSTFNGWGNDYSGFGDSEFLASIGLG